VELHDVESYCTIVQYIRVKDNFILVEIGLSIFTYNHLSYIKKLPVKTTLLKNFNNLQLQFKDKLDQSKSSIIFWIIQLWLIAFKGNNWKNFWMKSSHILNTKLEIFTFEILILYLQFIFLLAIGERPKVGQFGVQN
jgi:hypothetical protein